MTILTKLIDQVTVKFDKDAIRILKAYIYGPINISDSYLHSSENILNYLYSVHENWKLHDKLFPSKNVKSTRFDFQGINMLENQKIYLFSNIRCNVRKSTLWSFSKLNGRVWVNNDMFIVSRNNNEKDVIIQLKEGDNLVVIELDKFIGNNMFNLLISDISSKNNNQLVNEKLLLEHIELHVQNQIQIIHEKINEKSYNLLILPIDYVNLSPTSQLDIKIVDQSNKIVYSTKSMLKIPIQFNTFDALYYRIIVEYSNKYGEVFNSSTGIINGSIKDVYDILIHKFNSIQSQNTLDENIMAFLLGVISDISKITELSIYDHDSIIELIELFNSTIDVVNEGMTYADLLFKNNVFIHYYLSKKTDGQIEKLYLVLPQKYDDSKKYPLILICATNIHENFASFKSNIMSSIKDMEVIIGYVTGKGVTMGSYIGEVATIEGLNQLTKTLSIDEDRVYLTGSSNGAFATWNIAQAYPHKFAAIAPLSGVAYNNNLLNLSHLPILNMSSENDVYLTDGYKIPEAIFSSYSNHQGIYFIERNHSELAIFRYSSIIFKWLLNYQRNDFPSSVYFRTERLRHRKTCWIEVLEFQNSESFIEVNLKRTRNDELHLMAKNIKTMSLSLPAEMINKKIKIIINKKIVKTFCGSNLCVYFSFKENEVFILSSTIDVQQIDYNAGHGILGIYMDHMKIIVPSKFDNDDERDSFFSVAKNLSSPKTNGFSKDLNVSYPILHENQLSFEEFALDNCIYINTVVTLAKSKYCNQVQIPIIFDNYGYYYGGEYYKKSYIILYITDHPLNRNKQILMVISNDLFFLRRQLYMRRLIIPSYTNGLHKYLNKSTIIIDNSKTIDVSGNNSSCSAHNGGE